MSVQDLSGVLFFPVTPFTAVGTVDTESLTEHLRQETVRRAAEKAGLE